MASPDPLSADALYRRADLSELTFQTTDELPDLERMVGQDRAIEALQFGAGMRAPGYNLFVLGPNGSGKHTVARGYLHERARGEAVPQDRGYVNDFRHGTTPRLITLSPGRGRRFAEDLDRLCDELRTAIPATFESEEYQNRLHELQRSFGRRQEQAIREIQEEAEQHEIALIATQSGFTFAPRKNGETLDHDAFRELPKDEQERTEQTVEELQQKLQRTLQQFPKWRKESQEQLKQLNEEMAQVAVGQAIDDLRQRYADVPKVLEHLDAVRRDVVDNIEAFRQGEHTETLLDRYRFNVLVDHGDSDGAPVVYEDLPTYHHLIGRIEHRVSQGALTTDFSLIKPGALHRANGGYLVLDALKVLSHPFAWQALKRALYAGQLRIESLEQIYSAVTTVSLQPEADELDVKVVLLGDRMLYYLLSAYDPDFAELFKVQADFEDDIGRDADSQALYARLIATLARRERLPALDRAGVGRVIEQAARLAGDAERMTMHARALADLLHEAAHYAREAAADVMTAAHVQAAIDGQDRRASRVREQMERQIQRGTLWIESDGARVGQVNGLAVMQLGGHAFGKATRISATARLGPGQLIDIEREARLGGNIHSKAVMLIGNYIGARYAAERPLSLHASIAFEQNYGGVEGDSASVAELCALLSALAGVGLSQALAVTGSVDQHGRVQAVGGVNEKIEGFFDTCAARGFAQGQGVLLPRANAVHLMLRQDVREAVEAGRFRIVPLAHVDESIELLTGMPAGQSDGEGQFPDGTFNRRVVERLDKLAQIRQTTGEPESKSGRRSGENTDDVDPGDL